MTRLRFLRPMALATACAAACVLLLAAPAVVGAQGITDGSSNTVLVGETPFGSTGCFIGTRLGVRDGEFSRVAIRPGTAGAGCQLPIGGAQCVVMPSLLGGVTDGTSNTILVGEAPTGPGCFVPIADSRCYVVTLPRVGVTDGTSNTFLIGERRAPGCYVPIGGAGCTVSRITDGTSNTIVIGEGTPGVGCDLPVSGTGDLPTVGAGGPCPGISNIRDGSSNTIVLGSCSAATTVTPEPATAGLLGGGLLLVGAFGVRQRRRTPA